MTEVFVIDTYAWIEYFRGTPAGAKAKEFIENMHTITPTIVIAELSFKYEKEKQDFLKRLEFIKNTSKICPLDERIAIIAGKINFRRREKIKDWGVADSIILTTAEFFSAAVVTGDEHFRDVKGAVMIK